MGVETSTGDTKTPASGGEVSPDLAERIERAIGAAVEGLTKAFDARLKPVEGKLGELGRDNARLRHRLDGRGEPGGGDGEGEKGGDRSSPKGPETKSGVTSEDLSAAMALGELRAKLTDAAREDLDKLKEDGATFQDQLRLARMLEKHTAKSTGGAPANGNDPKPPNGSAATAAHRDTPALPSTWAELLKLRDTDRKAYEAVWKNPEFDTDSLKR